MDDDELSAKGSGGTRQMHSYADINYNTKIETPEEDYSPDKIDGNITVDKLQEQRMNEVPKPVMKI